MSAPPLGVQEGRTSLLAKAALRVGGIQALIAYFVIPWVFSVSRTNRVRFTLAWTAFVVHADYRKNVAYLDKLVREGKRRAD